MRAILEKCRPPAKACILMAQKNTTGQMRADVKLTQGKRAGDDAAPRRLGGALAAALLVVCFVLSAAGAQAAATLRIGAQKTGTLAWELAVIKAEKLDAAAGLDLSVSWLASPEAGKIALLGGSVDVILADWLWAARERALSAPLAFSPYSTALGAVMVGADSPVQSLDDLAGRTLAVAGGPIDKSWLLLRAYAQRRGLDLKEKARVVFGAPALLYEKTLSGEVEASLAYWNYAARLEARGFRRLVDMGEVERALGAAGPIAMLGYVFDDAFAAANGEALERFFAIARQAREKLAASDADWARIGKEIGVSDQKELDLFRRRYVEGFPTRPAAQEEADAARLYLALREIGGAELVGPAASLDPGVFYKGAPAPAQR